MTTWSSRPLLACLAFGLLAGCEEGAGPGGLLAGLGGAPKNVALSQARMAFGEVRLVPPPGFCIDQSSLSQQFALMARCDRLGAPSAAGDAPLALITASFSPAPAEAGLPTAAHSASVLDLEVLTEASTDDRVLFQATGAVPADMGARHWRGSARMGGQIVGLALYGPEDGAATGAAGGSILSALIDGSSVEN